MGIPIPEFKVLLYGPGVPAAGLRARAHFECKNLVVTAHGLALTTPAQRIKLKTGGYDGRQWLVSWETPEGAYAALLQSDEALEAFIELAPPELGRQLNQALNNHDRAGRRFNLAVILLLLLPLLALGLLWANADRLGQWVVSHISLEQERQLGELAYTQLRGSVKFQERGAAPVAVAAIGGRLASESLHRYQFHVAIAPEINAYALPGGHIVVNTGLLQATDGAAELAGVLAHEISHVEQRHTLRALVRALGLRAMLGSLTGDFSGGVWSDMAARLSGLAYSRELESEADRDGLEILRRAGVTPHGLETFLMKLAARNTDIPAFLSSHPADQERLAALREAIARQPMDGIYPLAVDWERVKADL